MVADGKRIAKFALETIDGQELKLLAVAPHTGSAD